MINFEEGKFYQIFLKTWRPFFWLAVAAFLVYSLTLFSGLVYLDDNVLVSNQYNFNKKLANIPQAFVEDIFRTPNDKGTFYRPLLRLSFMADAQFGEEQLIFVSHFNNICLHIAAIFLFFIFLLKLNIKKSTAFLFSLIGAVHPLTAQTVAFIPGRNDSLLAIFIFSAFILLLDFVRTKKLKYFFGHLIFFILALLTKETAVILPFIGAVYLLIFIGWKKLTADFPSYLTLGIYWAGIIIVWFLLRRLVLNNFIGNADYNIILSIFHNLPSLIPAIGKIFLPFGLSVFPVLKDMSFVYGIIVLIGLALWFFYGVKKDWRFVIFGLSWFLIFIFLTLVKPVGTVPEFSENRLYLPLFGFFFVILGLGWVKLPKKIIFIGSLLIIVIFSSITIYRNRYYRDSVSFWKNAAETSPNFAFNQNNLGAMYYLDNQLDLAVEYYNRALAINPDEAMVHNNIGLIYMNQGLNKQAEEEFKKELSLYPTYDKALFNLGSLYYNTGREEEGIELWRQALIINPYYYEAYTNLLNCQNPLR